MSCTCLASACWHSSRGPSCSSVCMWSSATHHACILASTTKQNLPTHHMPTTYVAHPPLPPPHGNTYMHIYNGPVFCSLKIGTCSVAGLLCFCNLLGIMLPCPALSCSVLSPALPPDNLLCWHTSACVGWFITRAGCLSAFPRTRGSPPNQISFTPHVFSPTACLVAPPTHPPALLGTGACLCHPCVAGVHTHMHQQQPLSRG